MKEKNSFINNKIDFDSPNKNIVPLSTTINNGELFIGGCSLEQLIKNYDSPLYVLDELTLRNSCKAYKLSLIHISEPTRPR